jgi:hypothetical protein
MPNYVVATVAIGDLISTVAGIKNAGRKIISSAYTSGGVTLVVDGPYTDAPVVPPGPSLPLNARLYISIGGQSNALGTDAQNALTTVQPYDAIRAPGNPTGAPAGFVALTEANIAPNFGESPASALANMLHELDPSGRQVMIRNWAIGSTPYLSLAQGTAPYNDNITAVDAARDWLVANRPAELFYPAALVWIHGENDEGEYTAAQYAAAMVELHGDFQTDVQAAIGNTNNVIMMLAQHGASAELNPSLFTVETAIGCYIAARDNAGIYLACPQYMLTWVANNPHLNNSSARRLGRYIGRALKNVLIDGADWKPLQPSNIAANNNVLTLTFEGGNGSQLVLDTVNVAQRSHTYGFDYADAQADIPAITNVQVVGTNQVQITLNRNAQAPASIKYGNYSAVGDDPGALTQLASGGNLRDSDPTPSGDGDRTLENWCVVFDRTVDSVIGAASAATGFLNTHSLDSTGANNNLASARALDALNGLADGTVEFYLRYNLAAWPGAASSVLSKARSGQRQIDIRRRTGGPAGSLTFFISTGLSDAANFYDVTLPFVGQTWYHIVMVKEGATITVYVNGAVVAGALTGAVPATFTSAISDFCLLSAGTGASGAYNICQVSLYRRALSAASVTERYNAGVAIDPRLLSTGGPDHYWPLSNTTEDLGSRATRNLFLYSNAGTLTFEAIHPN